MNRLLLILILTLSFQSSAKADDIRDFQIEGMSIGDSLLDYFDKEEIIVNKSNYPYKDKTFYSVSITSKKFRTYESLQIHLKTNDKKYIIYSLGGINFFENNINDCYKVKKNISSELSSKFENVIKEDHKKQKSSFDDSSTIESTYFFFKTNDYIKIQCYDWSEKLTKEKNWIDNLRIVIAFEEYYNWTR
tara:strand:+ start:47 stop:616 length:570 start_codon:yes stop_codon:yes gene_type:complete